MAPRQQDIEMDNIGSKAGDRDPESLQQLPRGLSWTKSWKASVRILCCVPVKTNGN